MPETENRDDPPQSDASPDFVDQILAQVCDGIAASLKPWAAALLAVMGSIAVLLTVVAAMVAVLLFSGKRG